MPEVRFEGRTYVLNDGETVLDGLLRHGLTLQYSCKAGVCGSCVMRVRSGSLPAKAQAGLRDSWKARGYFYACACVPETTLDVMAPGADLRFGAAVSSLRRLSPDVIQVRLAVDTSMDFRAGQYVTVVREDGLARSYSIASLPDEGLLELHVRRIPQGRMSGWFHDQARAGDRIAVIGPAGECFYVEGREQQPLLLVGAGTGLAPLSGILKDAIRRGHRGSMELFHGALRPEGLYLVEELRALAAQHPQVRYTPVVLTGEAGSGVDVGELDAVIVRRFPNLAGWRGFVCGDPNLVQKLKKKLFLAGMASRDIYADAFIPAAGGAG